MVTILFLGMGLAFAFFGVYKTLAVTPGEEMHLRLTGEGYVTPAEVFKQVRTKLRDVVIGDARKRKFEFAGVSTATFLFMRFGMAAFGLTFFSIFVTPAAGVFMALLAWGGSAAYLHSTYQKARERLASSIPDLSDYLAITLEAGLSVPLAVEAVLPFLAGPMMVAWRQMITRVHGRVPLKEALSELAAWSEDAAMAEVVQLLQSYLEFGVPQDPFHELTDHINKLRIMQKKFRLGVMTTGTSFYAAAGLVAAVGAIVLPFLVNAFLHLGIF